jgi:hypothetical protein
MEKQTFGIEIEMNSAPFDKVAAALISAVGGRIGEKVDSRGRRRKGVFDEYNRFWAVVPDSSIGGIDTNELVSPVLKWEDLEVVQKIVRALREAGCKSRSADKCGIHIHVGKQEFSPRAVVNLINIIATRQKLIYKALVVDSQRVSYCKELGETFISLVESKKPRDFESLRELWYRAFPDSNRLESAHYHGSRYQGLNLHSLFSGDTVEFRLFNGTLHAGLIRTYILFVLALSAQAQKLKSSRSNRRDIEIENEKYSFRCWLLRLGFIGDYFKNPRFHLLENLSGDSAWRYPESRATGQSPMVARARSLD